MEIISSSSKIFSTRRDNIFYLKNLSTSMSRWYYEESSGIFLSINSRNEYFVFQEELKKELENVTNLTEKLTVNYGKKYIKKLVL
jgi:hypothetical protein